MLASAISQMEIGGNRRLVCQKAKRTDAVNGGEAVHLDHWQRSAVLLLNDILQVYYEEY